MDEATEYLRDAVRVAVAHLRMVGAPDPDAFIVALSLWQGDPPETASAQDQRRFANVYFSVCSVLEIPEHEPDLRPWAERNEDELSSLQLAYELAGKAQL